MGNMVIGGFINKEHKKWFLNWKFPFIHKYRVIDNVEFTHVSLDDPFKMEECKDFYDRHTNKMKIIDEKR